MKTLRIALTLLLVGATAALAAAPAGAKTAAAAAVNPIVKTCEHDGYRLPGTYSVAALKAAYNSIGASVRNYETCAQVIETKLESTIGNKAIKGTGGGSGSSFPWIIVVIVVILILGGGGAFWSYRRSQAEGRPDDGPDVS